MFRTIFMVDQLRLFVREAVRSVLKIARINPALRSHGWGKKRGLMMHEKDHRGELANY